MYLVLTVSYVTILLISNMVAPKLFSLGSSAVPMGLVTYPITFALTDIITELYGGDKARRAIYLAFFMNLSYLVIASIAVYLPAHPLWYVQDNRFGFQSLQEYQNAYAFIFNMNGKVILASLTAYLAGQLLDVRIFETVKRWTGRRHLWLRNNASTLVSQLVDTCIVSSITLMWGFGMDFSSVIQIMAMSYFYKAVIALLDTPVVYFFCAQLRNRVDSPV